MALGGAVPNPRTVRRLSLVSVFVVVATGWVAARLRYGAADENRHNSTTVVTTYDNDVYEPEPVHCAATAS